MNITKRQSLMLRSPRQLGWSADSLDMLLHDEVLVRTRKGAISVGTEMPLYMGTHRSSTAVRYPLMTGYESLGVVTARGAAVQNLALGQRVVAFYGHRTHAVLPASRVVPVPDDISDEAALLLILACDTAKGVQKVAVSPADKVLITGAGAIGLLTLFNLKARGVQRVDIVEPLVERRDLARRLGATRATTKSATFYQVGFECSSRDAAFGLLQRRMEAGGRICVLADGNLEPLVLRPEFHQNELAVVGSSDGLDYASYAPWFWEQVRTNEYEIERIFNRRVNVQELPQIFEAMMDPVARAIKVLVEYS